MSGGGGGGCSLRSVVSRVTAHSMCFLPETPFDVTSMGLEKNTQVIKPWQ